MPSELRRFGNYSARSEEALSIFMNFFVIDVAAWTARLASFFFFLGGGGGEGGRGIDLAKVSDSAAGMCAACRMS